MRKALITILKLGICGATIFAIGWLMLVTDSDGDVKKADADIADTVPMQAMYGSDFTEVVSKTGLQPRPYEVNGNKVFFAVAKADMGPQEVLEFYQDRFVKAGINDKKILSIPDGKFQRTLGDIQDRNIDKFNETYTEEDHEYNTHLLNGGVVPVAHMPHYVSMAGLVPRKKAKHMEELFVDWQQRTGDVFDFDANTEGFRFIDAYSTNGEQSRVTSVWADEGFSHDKMNNPNQEGVAPIGAAPACVGCSLGSQVASLMPQEPYKMRRFDTRRGVQDVSTFYKQAMTNRGFEQSHAWRTVDYARQYFTGIPGGAVLDFRKGDKIVTVAVMPTGSGTSVVTMQSDGGPTALNVQKPYAASKRVD